MTVDTIFKVNEYIMSNDPQAILDRAEAWKIIDPNPNNQVEINELIKQAQHQNDFTELEHRFSGRLHFGTAGLRGAIGAGPHRMNQVLIRWVSLGLGDYLNQVLKYSSNQKHKVVIAYDARDQSDAFAQEAAECLSSQGFDVELSKKICPTPILAFAVCQRRAVAGIMVTASHNPPQDNGFKVYWGNGAQIIPPQDHEISTAIDQVAWARLTSPTLEQSTTTSKGQITAIDLSPKGEIGQEYQALLGDYLSYSTEQSSTNLKVVYTPMHGVGGTWFEALCHSMQSIQFIPVTEQFEPDPKFSTVSFPNPEEPGALDLAKACAAHEDADLILAHDPDADRLAVVARDQRGQLKAFTGDQVGALVAYELFNTLDLQSSDMVATTIVSSSLLSVMAKRVGIQYAETLTGFKWIANRALAHQKDGGRFLFGYEEAIGYSMFGLVNDKDGLSAGCFVLNMALRAKAEGLSLWDRLAEVYQQDGLYLSSLISRVRKGSQGKKEIASWMKALRTHPLSSINGSEVAKFTDFNQAPAPLTGNVLRYHLADGSRIIVRPSGTEPKLKLYFEVCVALQANDSLEEQQLNGQKQLDELGQNFLAMLDRLSLS